MTNQIWTVGCRKNQETHMETTPAFTASSPEKALEWIKKNEDYDYGDFWWSVSYDEIDIDIDDQNPPGKDLFLFNKKGEEIFWQPATGEKVIYYGDKIRFVLNFVHEGVNNEHTFEGVLLSAKSSSVLLKEVIVLEDQANNIPFKKIGHQILQPEEIHFIKSIQ